MSKDFINSLIEVGKLDASLAHIFSEQELALKKYTTVKMQLNKKAVALSDKSSLLNEKKSKYETEERQIKEERDKLVARRKAISTFNDYKVQQTAQKEVEYASKQLDQREENLFPLLEETENLKKDYDKLVDECKALKEDLDKLSKEKKETEIVFKQRKEEKLKQRDEITKNLNDKILLEYNKVKNKYPTNPVVGISSNNCCEGCSMKLGSQVVVNVAKGESIVHCPGCNRILYISNSANDSEKQE